MDAQVQTGQVIVEFQEVLGFGVFTDDDGIVYDPGELGFPFDDGEEDPNGFGGPPAIQIYDGYGSASSADPSGPSIFEGSRYDKDVGICTAETSLDSQGRETILEITISNSYPSYWCTTYFSVKNTDSVPVKLQSATLTSVFPPLDFGFFFWCVDTDGFSPPVAAEGGSFGNGCIEVDEDILVQSPEDYDIAIGVCPSFGYPLIEIGAQIDPHRLSSKVVSDVSCSTSNRVPNRATKRPSRSRCFGSSGTSSLSRKAHRSVRCRHWLV